jgi:diguanylate cyclase (GGDEF)-like protein/PAS domain S-box-containing protein
VLRLSKPLRLDRLRLRRGATARDRLRHAEAKYRTLVEQLPLVTYIDALTATASGIYASPQIESLLGYTPDEWINDPEIFAKLLHTDDRERILALVDHCNNTGAPFRAEYRLMRADGAVVWVQDESLVVRDEEGTPLFTQGYLLDVTEKKEAEIHLLAEQSVARVLAEATSVEGAIPRVVDAVCATFGWATGRAALRDLEGSQDDDAASVAARVWATSTSAWHESGGGTFAVPVLLRSEVLGVLEFTGVREPDDNRRLTLAVIASQLAQFIERKDAEAKLRHQALHDALTGLPNRTLFHDRVAQGLRRSQRTGLSCAVLLMDLDRFKEVNDTLGHEAGDALLHQLGDRLQSCMRGDDTVARIGGDEFGFLLTDVDGQLAREIVARIQLELRNPFTVQGLSLHVEASVGIAVFPEHGDSGEQLLQRADVAMYTAKRAGSGFAFYDANHDDHTPTRLVLIGDLRRALDSEELTVHYQPQVELESGRVAAVEALLRWEHPTHGLLHPEMFLPAAERGGLAGLVTRYVLEQVLRHQQQWQSAGRSLPVAVNVSMLNLLDQDFPGEVVALLEQANVPPELLTLEITEHTAVIDSALVESALAWLGANGVRVAIDDFGTGYSSLARLRRLPLHAIKVDRSFVQAMTSDADDAAIVRSTIDLAHNLGLEVIAEGVATADVYNELRGLDCDLAQGFFIASPMSEPRLTAWIDALSGRTRSPRSALGARSSQSTT